jgi:hypothetical protein
MATKTENEIRLEVLQLAAEIANTSWLEEKEKVKYEAQKNNAATYTLPPDERLKNSIRNARRLYKYVTEPVTAATPSASATP